MKTNLCYIISDIDKALAFEWVAERLDNEQFNLFFILLNKGDSVLENFLKEKNIPVYRIAFFGKKDLPKAIFQIYKFLKKYKIQAVHCHLFEANVAGLFAAKLAGVRKRIYTRHHSMLHHEYFPRAVWYDKCLNFLATHIVAISENVKKILSEKENVSPQKVRLIHHGFDLEKFTFPNPEKVQLLKEKYRTETKFPVIGSIARYVDWKGIQYLIPAFEKILQKFPQAHLILANAKGDYTPEIRQLLQKLPTESYTEIDFEQDLYSLYQLFDIFVHIPVNPEIEAFGQTYVEALAAGIPSVFTLSGVAPEFIKNEENAITVDFKNSAQIENSILKLLNDKTLQEKISKNGKEIVRQYFKLDDFIRKLEDLYEL